MSAISQPWPNGLGVDIGDVEVWFHPEVFRVFTPTKVLRVPYSVTKDPFVAVALCEEQGLLRETLEDMDPREAQELYVSNTPTQAELF